jgi:hypothetical protein
MAPLLFVIFTDDLPEVCVIAQLILYVDDTTGFVTGKTIEDVCQKLEAAAHEVLGYVRKINKLSLNEGKTQLQVFGREGARDIKVKEATVWESKMVVIFGATIYKTLDWYDQVPVFCICIYSGFDEVYHIVIIFLHMSFGLVVSLFFIIINIQCQGS